MAFLCGPRGNGKTVPPHWLEGALARAGAPGERTIARVRTSRTEMASPLSAANTILSATSGALGRFSLGLNVAVPGLGSILVTDAKRSQSLSLAPALLNLADPLLTTLDEAREAPPEMPDGLLDVAQVAGRRRPIVAAFAGTPGLEAALRAAHASFWTQGEERRIGLPGGGEPSGDACGRRRPTSSVAHAA